MAKREPTRKIKLPPLGGGAGPVAPGRATGPVQNDEVGDAIDRSAKVLNRNQLPDRVKVITPQVIRNIVHSIVDQFEGGADAEQLAQLATEQTQLQLKLQQAQGKLQGAQEHIEQLQAHIAELRGQLENASAGAETPEYYMEQIQQLQQSNAKAVDTYMDVQRALEEREAQLAESEAAGEHMAAEMLQLRDQLANVEPELERLRQLEAEAADAQNAVQDLGAQVDSQREEIERLQARIDELESGSAEQSEGVNQERIAREQAERDRDAAEGRITALEDELAQVREELATAQAAQDRVGELEVALAEMRGQLDEERAKAQGELEGESKKQSEIAGALEKKNRELSDQLRDANVIVRKYENVSIELEKLRMAEGQWLEQKRQLASQLSHETNLRREADAKLKAIEKGEVVPGTSKILDAAAKQAKAEADGLRKELEDARKAHDATKKELEAAQKKLADAQGKAGEVPESARKRIAELEAQVAARTKEAESGSQELKSKLDKAEEKARKLNDELKEANVVVRKFDNVAAELEKLRMAEGQWLEQKRQLASQLSHETNLRREADAKLKAIEKGEIKPGKG